MSDPYKLRRGSKKEFSRVYALIKGNLFELLDKVNKLESRVKKLEEKRARKKKKNTEETE